MSIGIHTNNSLITTIHDKENPYTIISNRTLHSTLSLAGVGFLTFLLSFPKNWNFSVPDLARRRDASLHSTYKAMGELIQAGHVIRYQETNIDQNRQGRRGKIKYLVFEGTLSLEKRIEIVEQIAYKPYFPDISRPQKKRAKKASTNTCVSHAAPSHATKQNLLNNNNKLNTKEGNDINDCSLPFSIEMEIKQSALPQEKAKPVISHQKQEIVEKATKHLTPTPNQKQKKTEGGFYLSEESKKTLEWLKYQNINTDDQTLSWWAKNYPLERIQDVLNFANERQKSGQHISNIGGWVHKFLKSGLSVVNDTCKYNAACVKNFVSHVNWPELKIYEKHVVDETTGSDLSLTMSKEEFKIAFFALRLKSQTYRHLGNH